MAFQVFGRSIERVAVIGSGQIGPDIALHFSKVLAPHGARVVVVDVAEEALERGRSKLEKKVLKGVETGAFKEAQGQAILSNVTFTSDYEAVKGSTIVVEAATENLDIKRKIFQTLEGLVDKETLLTSNSSHLEPERVFGDLTHPERGLITHYFFPAERNPAVEIVPAQGTDAAVTRFAMKFYEAIGKVPVQVASRYGFAVDPIFEGLFLAALLLVDEGVGTVKEVDHVAREALGQGVGPFTAMNLAGGNPITNAGMPQYHERVHPWFHSPQSLQDAAANGTRWPTADRGETITVEEGKAARIRDRMLGAYFGLATEVLDAKLITPGDLEMIVELALVMTPPLKLMNQVGVEKAHQLVQAYHEAYPDFPVPGFLADQAATGNPFVIDYILREDHEDVAVLTIRRPRVMNALSGEVFRQLGEHADRIARDANIQAVVLTGFGVKAFAAGADINELASLETGAQAAEVAQRDQSRVRKLETLGKPVVCALNGLAFGGGAEVAQACTVRIAPKGLKVCFGQPEVNLGIIPGCGGTQRLPRIVGVPAAWEILRNGRPVNGAKAHELGFLFQEVEGDLIEAAVNLARDIAQGRVTPPAMEVGPIEIPGDLPDVGLGHLSTEVDGFVQRAFREGLTRPLEEGLGVEATLFGEVFDTEDSRIGLKNFVENGPKKPAAFKSTAG